MYVVNRVSKNNIHHDYDFVECKKLIYFSKTIYCTQITIIKKRRNVSWRRIKRFPTPNSEKDFSH